MENICRDNKQMEKIDRIWIPRTHLKPDEHCVNFFWAEPKQKKRAFAYILKQTKNGNRVTDQNLARDERTRENVQGAEPGSNKTLKFEKKELNHWKTPRVPILRNPNFAEIVNILEST